MTAGKRARRPDQAERGGQVWVFGLYVAGVTEKANRAFENLKKLCFEHFGDRCRIEVIDVVKHPEIAMREQIVAIPTLIKMGPLPIRRVIGDLSNPERVLAGLGLTVNAIC